MLVADIILEQTAFSFDKPYGYAVDDFLRDDVKVGCRVVVPFGRGNSPRQGMVIALHDADDTVSYKSVYRVIDEQPVLTEEMIDLCHFMHEQYFCTYFDAVRAVLPTGITFKVLEHFSKGQVPFSEKFSYLDVFFEKNSSASRETLLSEFEKLSDKDIAGLIKAGQLVRDFEAQRRMNDATMRSVRLLVDSQNFGEYSLTPRQREIAELIADIGTATIKEITYFTGVSPSVLSALEKKGVIELFDKEVYRSPIKSTPPPVREKIELTTSQKEAFTTLDTLISSDKGEAALLYGVTGSGKTSVFLSLVDRCIDEGKGAIIMVPEIALTPQTVSIFGNRYGKKIALFHSALSLGQRMDEWKRVKKGEATVAIGTRSAIFAPVQNLSLIIIDEEQEHTYKSEKSPRFHARDVARFRAGYNKALLLLASATPAVESYTAAKLGKYTLCTLSERYGAAKLPEVRTVDMRAELREGNATPLSRELKTAINTALDEGHQAIVLLNRRGHNTYISCPTCGYVATCPSCSVSLTYHSANNRLMCHYCGYSEPAQKSCPTCNNGSLRFMGVGTQKIEEELKATFPDAKILRLDADSTTSKDSYSAYLSDFADGKYNIMLGTQMVAKGLNFPNVTVVGVIGADSAANSSDYRSFERSFSLLTQVFGRAGRGDSAGVAIIQTTDPESNLIRLAASQDYDSFYNGEMNVRKMLTYPPYCDLAQITVQSSDKDDAQSVSKEVFSRLTEALSSNYADVKVKILGPSAAACVKINNKYRYRLLIKARNCKRLRELLRFAVDIKTKKDTSLFVDINPETII